MSYILPTDEELRAKLTPEEYDILRNKGTELPYTGDYLGETPPGIFVCKVCGSALFESTAKFNSLMGWPAFDQAIAGSVTETPEVVSGVQSNDVACATCGSHLGRRYEDGHTQVGAHYCINSASLVLDGSRVPTPRTPHVADTEETTA